ncbi:hypothetical protein J4440_02155 [Candidatus Woesearchaeota archaeon]|nr:hypothetical protein [Candidatus Woesearchaeota archaeon]
MTKNNLEEIVNKKLSDWIPIYGIINYYYRRNENPSTSNISQENYGIKLAFYQALMFASTGEVLYSLFFK